MDARSPDTHSVPSATPAPARRALPETASALTLRRAVRDWLDRQLRDGQRSVAVALSGGPDSLALTAAAVAEADAVHALVVDHGLQSGSDQVAATAAAQARALGARSARVLSVRVGTEGGMEAAARRARYAALAAARADLPVLLGHTLDDQAETVLLGLARGSGGRSIHGMTEYAAPWGRPLLGERRATTRQLCVELGLRAHTDPHNESPEFTRARLRTEVLPLLEEVLGGGVAAALARTAEQLRADAEVLDVLADELLDAAATTPSGSPPSVSTQRTRCAAVTKPAASTEQVGDGDKVTEGTASVTLSVKVLRSAPTALRRRAIRSWLLHGGAKALTEKHLRAIDALVTDWRGQGGVAVGGGTTGARLVAAREHGRLTLRLRIG